MKGRGYSLTWAEMQWENRLGGGTLPCPVGTVFQSLLSRREEVCVHLTEHFPDSHHQVVVDRQRELGPANAPGTEHGPGTTCPSPPMATHQAIA